LILNEHLVDSFCIIQTNDASALLNPLASITTRGFLIFNYAQMYKGPKKKGSLGSWPFESLFV